MSNAPPPQHSSTTPPPPPPPPIVMQQPTAFGRYGKYLFLLLGLAVMSLIGMNASYQDYFSTPGMPQEKYHSLNEDAPDKIAIVDISGTIMDADGFVKKQLDRIRKDEKVVAVVLRIDSPGGTVTASDYLYHHAKKLADERNLPMVVSMGSMCASGGYYIAMAVGDRENTIFAEPTTWTGSIGVVIPHYDFSELLDRIDVKDDSIASHKWKLMGSPTRDLPPEERAKERELFEELVDISFERFKEIVRAGRPKLQDDPAALEKATTGQIFTATQALELGLVDEVGFADRAIERAAELAGKSVEQVRCVKYEEPATPLGALLGAQAPARNQWGVELKALLDLSVPRAYYMCTSFPGLLQLLGD